MFAGVVVCVVEVFVAFVVDALSVNGVNALVLEFSIISETSENAWKPNFVVLVANEHTVEWLEGVFRLVKFEGFGVETTSVVSFSGGEELRTLLVGGFAEVESVEQPVELNAPEVIFLIVLDSCSEIRVILRIPSLRRPL